MSADGHLRGICATRLLGVDAVAPCAFGVANLLRGPGDDTATAFVIVGPLPDPATFGLSYYVFLVVDPDTGVAVINRPIVSLPEGQFGPGVYGGTSPISVQSCEDLPCGPVMVFAADINGLLGPQVAAGVLDRLR